MDDQTAAERPNAYRPEEVQRRTGLTKGTVYKAIKDGDLVARKYGRCTVVLAGDLDRFLANLPRVTR
jgi:excisionase family DNA binding protein